MERITVYCVLVSFWVTSLSPAHAVTVDHLPSKFDLSIELGRSDESWQKDFPIVARKLQRWLETLEGAGTVQSTVGGRGDIDSFQRAFLDHALSKLESEGIKNPVRLKSASDLESRIISLKSERGVRLFRWYRLRSLASFVNGRMEEATRLRRVAWALVPPEAEIPEWEGEDFFESLSVGESRERFFSWWRERKPGSGIACRIQIVDGPEASVKNEWRWNGFRVARPESGEFTLGHGIHELKVEKNGFEPWSTRVDCRKGGLKEVRVALIPRQLTNDQTATVLWVEPERREFKLFLHTPGVAFHEISTTAPLRVADLTHRVNADWPVASDAFMELLSEHRMAMNLSSVPATPAVPAAVATLETKSEWYEDWRFWTIVGVVGAGITAGVLASHNSKVESNRGWVTPRRR